MEMQALPGWVDPVAKVVVALAILAHMTAERYGANPGNAADSGCAV